MSQTTRQITSTLAADGALTVEIGETTLPAPSGSEVLIAVEAVPINPSDLGLLFGPADTAGAEYSPGRIVAQMPAVAMRAMQARVGQALPVGNECSGTVIAAGEDPRAQALLGKRVAAAPGTATFAEHVLCDAAACLPLLDNVSFEEGASAYVNPMTALGFVENMKMLGFTGIVHTAAASNLGQMLVRICAADGIPLVNVVRSEAQVALLKGIGAEHVINMTEPDFIKQLIAAIEATGAMIGFDAIGGGTLASQILTAMEAAASKGKAWSRYGTASPKHVYIYGALDLSPTVLTRNFGFQWDLSGWLLMPFLMQAGRERVEAMRQRVMHELPTTFASHYVARVSLEEALTQEAVSVYNARRTGEKYLIVPNAST